VIWYGTVRGLQEFLREGCNWTLGGIATAQLIGIGLVVFGIAWLAYNHRPGSEPYPYLPPYEPPAEGEAELATEPAFGAGDDEDDGA
jgi:hypothetical protein